MTDLDDFYLEVEEPPADLMDHVRHKRGEAVVLNDLGYFAIGCLAIVLLVALVIGVVIVL